jgi:translation initiation factor IF-3
MEVPGVIKVIGETQTFGSGGFTKRELVVTTEDQYPQMIMIEFVQDKCDLLNKFKVGDNVKVSINLRGREWINPEGVAKYFNAIQGWRIEKLDASSSQESDQEEFQGATSISEDEPDDLPF